eukprot:3695932-Pleurochrysis_carterae.AAC.1
MAVQPDLRSDSTESFKLAGKHTLTKCNPCPSTYLFVGVGVEVGMGVRACGRVACGRAGVLG